MKSRVMVTAAVVAMGLAFGMQGVAWGQSNNLPPVAEAGGPYTSVALQAVMLDGSGSSDPEGGFLFYDWELGDGSFLFTSNNPYCAYVYTTPGTYTVTLTVWDNWWQAGEDTAIVTVSAPPISNLPPVANAGSDQIVNDADHNGAETVTLDGRGSSDPDGTIAAYQWKEGAATLGSGATLPVSLAVGAHTITLTVTDDDGATASDTVVVTVNAVINQPPVANAGPDQTVDDTDYNGSHAVTLDGRGSSDSDGAISGYLWKEGATWLGTNATLAVSLAVGVHTIALTVWDNDGATASDTVVVTVRKIDKINVSKAQYTRNSKELAVEAYTDTQGAVLTVQGYGQMTYSRYDRTKGYLHKYQKKPVADPLGSVQVTSSKGGSATRAVIYK